LARNLEYFLIKHFGKAVARYSLLNVLGKLTYEFCF